MASKHERTCLIFEGALLDKGTAIAR